MKKISSRKFTEIVIGIVSVIIIIICFGYMSVSSIFDDDYDNKEQVGQELRTSPNNTVPFDNKSNEVGDLKLEDVIPQCSSDTWSCETWSACNNGRQVRSCSKTLDCPTSETSPPPQEQNCKTDPSQLTAIDLYLANIERVKKAPYKRMTASYDSGVAIVKFFWEIDEIGGGSFVVEVTTDTYIGLDEYGRRVKVDYSDTFMFRDHDLDAIPDDYWDDSMGADFQFKKLDPDAAEYDNLIMIWAMANSYFTDNFINK